MDLGHVHVGFESGKVVEPTLDPDHDLSHDPDLLAFERRHSRLQDLCRMPVQRDLGQVPDPAFDGTTLCFSVPDGLAGQGLHRASAWRPFRGHRGVVRSWGDRRTVQSAENLGTERGETGTRDEGGDRGDGDMQNAKGAKPVSAADRIGYSPEIEGGRLDMSDVLEPIYQEASDAVGRKFEYPTE
jgi:hypothetical protein